MGTGVRGASARLCARLAVVLALIALPVSSSTLPMSSSVQTAPPPQNQPPAFAASVWGKRVSAARPRVCCGLIGLRGGLESREDDVRRVRDGARGMLNDLMQEAMGRADENLRGGGQGEPQGARNPTPARTDRVGPHDELESLSLPLSLSPSLPLTLSLLSLSLSLSLLTLLSLSFSSPLSQGLPLCCRIMSRTSEARARKTTYPRRSCCNFVSLRFRHLSSTPGSQGLKSADPSAYQETYSPLAPLPLLPMPRLASTLLPVLCRLAREQPSDSAPRPY